MKKRTTLTLTGAASALALALALSATAASAQDYGRYDHDRYNNSSYDNGRYDNGRDDGYRGDRGGWTNIDQRQAQLERRIDWGMRNGSLDRTEAAYLRNEARRIAWVESRYRWDGLNGWERADLDRRLDRLSDNIRRQTHDSQYGYGYGRDYRR